MNYKYAIFSDIDGTIYDAKKVICKENIKQAEIAISKNVPFIIATGNGLFKQVKKVGKIFDSQYAIVSNGAGIFDLKADKYIYKRKIPTEETLILLDIAKKYNVNFQFWDEDTVYCSKKTNDTIQTLIKSVMGAPTEIFDGNLKKEPFKFEFYDDEKIITKIEHELQKHHLEYAKMKVSHIEITYPEISKASAVKWLCNKLSLDFANVMAIGDSANDFKMLELVGYSYAMDNGCQDVKDVSKYYAADVNQSGLGFAIEDYLYRIKV